MKKVEFQAQDAKAKAKREKDSKTEFILLQRTISKNKIDKKNKELYDIQLLAKNQEFTYKPFNEERFDSIVKRAKQRVALGDDPSKKKGAKRIIGHQSELKLVAPNQMKPAQQVKGAEEILQRMTIQCDILLGI